MSGYERPAGIAKTRIQIITVREDWHKVTSDCQVEWLRNYRGQSDAIHICTLIKFVPDKPEDSAFQCFHTCQLALVTMAE